MKRTPSELRLDFIIQSHQLEDRAEDTHYAGRLHDRTHEVSNPKKKRKGTIKRSRKPLT